MQSKQQCPQVRVSKVYIIIASRTQARRRGKRAPAWYPPFAHALNFPTFDIPGIPDKTASFPWLVDVRYVFVTVSRSYFVNNGVPSALATWVCSDDARTRAEGISEVNIRRDTVYALVLVSHCVIPFVLDVKLT